MGDLDVALARIGARHAAAVVVDEGGIVELAGEPAHRFALASVTKLLSAYAALVAVEEGTIALDDPGGPPGATVRHLLAHASGLGPEAADGVIAAPGERRIYSNVGFETLAGLVERASAMEFPRYLDESVLTPLAMSSTALEGSAARGASSSADDLARFAAELLAPSLVDPSTLAAATTVAFPGLGGVLPGYGAMAPLDWGLGFELRDHKRPHWTGSLNTPETFGHFGQSGTFCSVDPVARLAIVVLTDVPFGTVARREWPVLADGAIVRHRS
jgi:CubicO group peptidase (beta-lactamase class C family)